MSEAARRILFVGFIADKDTLAWAFRDEKAPQVSAVEYQLGILEALAVNRAKPVIISTLPIASYPANGILGVKGRMFRVEQGDIPGRLLGYINLPIVKLICRFFSVLAWGGAKLIGPIRCDSIVVYSIHAPHLFASVLLGRILRRPVAVFINDLPVFMGGTDAKGVHAVVKRFEMRLTRWVVGQADLAIPVSVRIAEEWLPQSLRSVVVEAIAPSRRVIPKPYPRLATSSLRRHPRLLYTGTFSYVLKFAQLFSVNRDIDAELVFVGGGPDEEDLRRLSAEDPRIQVKSFMTGEALEMEIENSDFLVNARRSDWEGGRYSFAFKLFDYMIRGRPILSTRLGSITDDYFTCFLPIEDNSAETFSQSMKKALATPVPELCNRIAMGIEIVRVRKAPPAVGRLILDALVLRGSGDRS